MIFFIGEIAFQLTFELIKRQRCRHIEISQLIFSANQLNGFYLMAILAFNELIIHAT